MTRSYLEGEKDPYKAVVKKLVGQLEIETRVVNKCYL